MTQFGTPGLAPRNEDITNGREVLAYALAQLLKLAVVYALTFARTLGPLYVWAFHTAGQAGIFAISIVLNAIWLPLVLIVFLTARGLLGGVPAIVAQRADAFTSSGSEIGAFVLAYVLLYVILVGVNIVVLSKVYIAFGPSLAPLLGLTISIIAAAATYVVFVFLRRSFAPV
jgi:hypothetical protein